MENIAKKYWLLTFTAKGACSLTTDRNRQKTGSQQVLVSLFRTHMQTKTCRKRCVTQWKFNHVEIRFCKVAYPDDDDDDDVLPAPLPSDFQVKSSAIKLAQTFKIKLTYNLGTQTLWLGSGEHPALC